MSASSKSTIDSTKSESAYVSSHHATEAFKVLHCMRGNMEFCDITLKAGNLALPAHRVVLAALSPYFREVLSVKGKEQANNELTLPGEVDSEALATMIEFFYTGTLRISFNNIEDILAAASLLRNEEALQALSVSAMANVTTSNCLRLQQIARNHHLQEMKEKVDRFIEWNFKYLAKEPDFLALKAHHVIDIVGSENLRVRKEEVVYESVMRWYRHDPSHRRDMAEKVFEEVRFCQIAKRTLKKVVLPELVEKEQMCRELLEKALQHHDNPGEYPCRPRKPLEAIYVISRKDSLAERYDPVQSACVPCYPMVPLEEDELGEYRSAVVIGQSLYTVFPSRVERFDPIAICWEEVGPGMETRDSGVCASKDSIYVVGGRAKGNGVFKYSIENSTWALVSEMHNNRRLPGVAFLNNKLFVFGGYGSTGPLASAECYNTKQNKWTSIKSMRTPRFQFGVAVNGNAVYILGGRDNESDMNSVEVYDTKAKTWSETPDLRMLEARSDFGTVVQRDEIYCFGGRGVNTIERYNFETQEWKIIGHSGEVNFAMDCVLFPPI